MRPDLDVLGAKIREARQRLGLTQAELSNRVDCSPEWISKIERGKASPSLVTVTRIGRELGTDMTHLLDGNHADCTENDLAEYGASMLRAFEPETLATAICLMEALLKRQNEPADS